MATIVQYRDDGPPRNLYPEVIVSPSHESACCATEMRGLGAPCADRGVAFEYWRCAVCGFTVRRIVGVGSGPESEQWRSYV